MSQLLDSLVKTDPAQRIADDILGKPALLFSGQGSQEKGMGRDLADADPESMAYWKEAERISGLPLREIFWEGTEEAMNDTRALQPALTAHNFNLWRLCEARTGVRPAAAAGHSLGEIAAMAAAHVISPKEALRITSLRGKLMAEADPQKKGAMAAIVKLEEPIVARIVRECAEETGELLVEANYNTPVQTVISGSRNAVALACKKAKEYKGRGVELAVSGAFHSPMMEEANRELAPILEKCDWKDPRFPVFCNATGDRVTTAEGARQSLLQQMISPVFWVSLVRNLYIAGIRWWMEISPRAVLGKMIGPSLAGIAAQCDGLRIDLIHSLSSMLQ